MPRHKRDFTIKRVFEPPAADDGYRVLVDRLWPRGLKRADAAIDRWAKELAPSTALRSALHGGEISWKEFARNYQRELASEEAAAAIAELRAKAAQGRVTLLYAKQDTEQNNAAVLRDNMSRKP